MAKAGEYVAAERQLARAVQLTDVPESVALIRYHLGWVCEQDGRAREAARQYRQGLETLPEASGQLHKDLTEGLARVEESPPSNP